MNDYGEMFYGTLPPDTQDFRQVLAGIGRTIRERATTAGQRIVESAREARALQDQAFGDPTRPTRVTDEAALRRLTDMIMAGPLGFAPAGITKAVKTFQSADGYKFYELPDGKIVDNLNPQNVDMSWSNKKEFLDDMGNTVFQIGDELGKRRSTIESIGKPTQEQLLSSIAKFGEDDISKFYAARRNQIIEQERKANLSVVPQRTPNFEEFQELASKGQMQMAKSSKQEIDDLKSGKSKFAELNLNWDDPKTFKLLNKFESEGYKFIRNTMSNDPTPSTFIFKDFEDVKPVLNATNQAQLGKAYGYSDADIARFYTERFRGYPKEEVYQMYLRDTQGLLD